MSKRKKCRWNALCAILVVLAITITSVVIPGGSVSNAAEEGKFEGIELNDTFDAGLCKYRKIGLAKAQLIDASGVEGDFTVPATVTETESGEVYSVTEIGPRAFYENTNITSVDFRESQITKIGDQAFEKCTGLTGSLELPVTLEYIGYSSFSMCTSLNGILSIPENVQEIDANAFGGCEAFTELSLPESLEAIRYGAFMYCTELTGSVVIPDSVNVLEGSIFYGCTNLQELTLPQGIRVITDNLVGECRKLTSISMPDTVVKIEQNAFLNCTELVSVKLSSQLTILEKSAFHGCERLNEINLSDKLEQIGIYAFAGCSGLSVSTESEALYNLLKDSEFETVSMTGGDTPTGSYSFMQDQIRYHIFNPTKRYVEVKGYESESAPVNLSIPSTVMVGEVEYQVTTIDSNAFHGKTTLTSVVLPEGITDIGTQAFAGCTSLSSITLPETLKKIGWSAFADCTALSQIALPDGVENIRPGAFSKSGLLSVTIPSSMDTIEFKVFEGCNNLVSIEIPQNIKKIEFNAFRACENLENIMIKAELNNLPASAFYNVETVDDVTTVYDTTIAFETSRTNMQLLLVASIYHPRSLPIVLWDGETSIDDCAVAVMDGDCTINEDVVIGKEGSLLVSEDNTLTINKSLENNGLIQVEGNFVLDGTLTGTGTLNGEGTFRKRGITVSDVEEIPEQTYTGEEIKPEVTLIPYIFMGKTFEFDTDSYTVTYEDNVDAGEAKIIYSIGDRKLAEIPFTIAEVVTLSTPSVNPDVTPIINTSSPVQTQPSATEPTATVTPSQGIQSPTPLENNEIQNHTSPGDGSKNVVVLEEVKYIVHNNGTVTVSDIVGRTNKTIKIPDTITFQGTVIKVTKIDQGAFQNNKQIETVVIGKNIQEIGDKSFKGCTKLKKVIYSNAVEVVGKESFANCKKLKSVSLSNNKVSIGSRAFKNCKSLQKVTLGKKSTKVKKGAMAESMPSLVANETDLTTILQEEIHRYAALKLKISIGNNAFQNCINLKKTVINCAVQIIGNSAFRGCKNLRDISVRSLILKKVGKSALLGVKNCNLSIPKRKFAPYKKLFKNKGQGRKVIYSRV